MTAPHAIGRAIWASYLINGDSSGIEESDIHDADQFARYVGGYIFDCSEESFFARPEYPAGALPGDCVEFSFIDESR